MPLPKFSVYNKGSDEQ